MDDWMIAVNGILIMLILILLGILYMRRSEYVGDIEVTEDETGKKTYSLVLNSDPDDLEHWDKVVFKIKAN